MIKALIAELQAELAKYDKDTLAKIEACRETAAQTSSRLKRKSSRLMAAKREQDALGEQNSFSSRATATASTLTGSEAGRRSNTDSGGSIGKHVERN